MSCICLLCHENETPDGHTKICDPCYDNAGNFIEENAERIHAFPYLLEACKLALDEIDQWNEVMGGSEDPRTDEAIMALEEAIAMAV